ATRHRALAARVRVVVDRQRQRGVVAGAAREAGAGEALHAAPAVVVAALASRLEVDLLDRVLADVADPQVAGLAVEAPAPGVAHAVVPDRGHEAGIAHEGVVGGRAAVVVDAVHLAQRLVVRLRVAAGHVARARVVEVAAVTDADVQLAVRAEDDVAA